MIQHPEPIGVVAASEHEEGDIRRICKRTQLQSVSCNLGQVIDLSRHGVRIMAEKLPQGDGLHDIDLYAMDKSFTLRGRVVWTKRIAPFKVEFGMSFDKVLRDQKAQLDAFARTNRLRSAPTLRQPLRKAG